MLPTDSLNVRIRHALRKHSRIVRMLLRKLYFGAAAYPHCDSRFGLHIQFVVRLILMFEQSDYVFGNNAFYFGL